MIFSRFKSRANRSPEEAFWSWFQRNEARLFEFERDLERVFDELATAMHRVHPDLTFEFSPVRENGHREFVISAGGIKSAFPAVEALVDAAPDLVRWRWIKFRPRRSEATDITFNGRTVPYSEVHYLMARDNEKVGLVLFFDGFSEEERSHFGNVGYLYLDQLLGEYAVETQVGFIEFHSRESEYFSQARPFLSFRSTSMNTGHEHRTDLCAPQPPPNKALQLTCQPVTPLARRRARGAPACHAAELGR